MASSGSLSYADAEGKEGRYRVPRGGGGGGGLTDQQMEPHRTRRTVTKKPTKYKKERQ